MAHEIDMTTGKPAVFTVGQRPWHELGVTLTDAVTGDQALQQAGLNWKVEKRAAYSPNRHGVLTPVPNRWALHRTDTDLALGIVGDDYHPLQNEDLKSVMDALVSSKEATYVSGGSLCEGRRVWMLIELSRAGVKIKDDESHPYLLGGNGHDGWHSINFSLTSTFVVCMNTYSQAIIKAKAEGFFAKLRHSKNVGMKIEEIRENLNMLVVDPLKQLQEKAEALAAVKINATQLDVFLESLGFDPDATKGAAREKYQTLVRAFEEAPGQQLEARKGTLWGAVNAVSWYTDHARVFKTTAAKENFLIGGEGDSLKKKALETALVMASGI